MFDILIDQPKKRYYLLIAFMSACLLLSMVFDIYFGSAMISATNFNELTDIITVHSNSFYGYFFYNLITSPALYSFDWLAILLQILYAFIASLNVFDWLTVLGIVGFILSHKNKMSRLTLSIQSGYIFLRCIFIIAMFLYLYPAFVNQNATAMLARIHLLSMVLLVIHVVLFIGIVVYLFSIIKIFYLPEFSKADD